MFGLHEWLSGAVQRDTMVCKSMTYLTKRVQLPSTSTISPCGIHNHHRILTTLVRVYSISFPQVLRVSDLGTVEVEQVSLMLLRQLIYFIPSAGIVQLGPKLMWPCDTLTSAFCVTKRGVSGGSAHQNAILPCVCAEDLSSGNVIQSTHAPPTPVCVKNFHANFAGMLGDAISAIVIAPAVLEVVE